MLREETADGRPDVARRVSSPVRSRRRIRLLAVLALVGLVAVLAGIKVWQIATMIKAGKAFVPPPESVTSAQAQTANWPAASAAVGTLIAVHGVTLSSEVTGTVREILFDSGDAAKKGAVLVRMDTSVEQAQLASARADEDLAKITLARARKLRETGANAPSDLDAAAARATQTTATVANLEATIAKTAGSLPARSVAKNTARGRGRQASVGLEFEGRERCAKAGARKIRNAGDGSRRANSSAK